MDQGVGSVEAGDADVTQDSTKGENGSVSKQHLGGEAWRGEREAVAVAVAWQMD